MAEDVIPGAPPAAWDVQIHRFFTGEEAVAYGLVDRVIANRDLPGRARGFAMAELALGED